ncbi:MAG: GYD domain-containing protein [Xanthobacteraceae bacterium]|nr:GYD domain-containing protein [Xanthobacteraceae bacterium]MBV9628672.1 GYD domain-containing protein [Xanthobacteraceae bacterium]
MTLYLAQFAYTSEAWAALRNHPEDRTQAIEDLAHRLGCRFYAFYYSLGEYDGFVILDAPNETTVTAFILATIAPGHVRATKTTVLISAGAMFDALKSASHVEYHGPRGKGA